MPSNQVRQGAFSANTNHDGMRPVLVTTEHRGVFFGYVPCDADTTTKTLKLKDSRNVLFWSRNMRGFMGLANIGPDNECRIGPQADIELRAITSVIDVMPAAVVKWEAAPWAA